MTYKLNPEIGKIESPVILIFPDGKKRKYLDGVEVTEAVFDQRFVVKALRAEGNTVEIVLCEPEMKLSTWIGEEQTFF